MNPASDDESLPLWVEGIRAFLGKLGSAFLNGMPPDDDSGKAKGYRFVFVVVQVIMAIAIEDRWERLRNWRRGRSPESR